MNHIVLLFTRVLDILDKIQYTATRMNDIKTEKPDFYKIFSGFTTDKIEAIHAFTCTTIGTSSTSDLSEQLDIQKQVLGGILSSLSRTKINGEPLVVSIAKDPDEGKIWKLNEKVAPKEELKKITEDILSAVNKWKKSKQE